MKLASSALRAPAAVLLVVALVLISGAISIAYLNIQLLPNIEKPKIYIRTDWGSASPFEVESEVLAPQERELRGMPGLEEMNTSARIGRGTVNLTFKLDTDMQQAMLEVISRLNRMSDMPQDAHPPMIFLGGTGDSGTSLATLLLQTQPGNPRQVEEYIEYFDDNIRPELQRIPGVSELISIEVGSRKQLQVRFDPYKAAALGIQIQQIVNALEGAKNVSGGMVEVGKQQLMLRYQGHYSVQELGELVLKWQGNRPIKLSDIASVSVRQSDPVFVYTQNTRPSYFIRLIRQRDTNLLQAIEEVKEKVAYLNKNVLQDKSLKLGLSFDPSLFIHEGIGTIVSGLSTGVLLAVAVLWAFLGNLRSTLIVAVAIPVSFSVGFIFMALFGKSINLITLAAFSFASGMVLDAAIVVLENIQRKREAGIDKHRSVEQGTSEVAKAILASTLSTLIVFIPVMFMDDAIGQIFGDLAFVLTVTILTSAVAAIVVLPLIAHYGLNIKAQKSPFSHLWVRLTQWIMKATDTRLKRGIIVFTLIVFPVLISVVLLPKLDYLPAVSRLMVNTLAIIPNSLNMDTLNNEVISKINARLKPHLEGEAQPPIKNFYAAAVSGFVFVGAQPYQQEQVPQVIELLQDKALVDITGVTFHRPRQEQLFTFAASDVFAVSRYINIQLQGNDSERLREVAKKAMESIASALPKAIAFPQPVLDYTQPEIRVKPHNTELGRLQVTHSELSGAIQAYGDGLYIEEYPVANRRLDMVLRAETRQSREELATLPFVTSNGQLVPVSQLADLEYRLGPSELQRTDGVRTITITVTPPDSMSIEETMAELRDKVHPALAPLLKDDVFIRFTGNASDITAAVHTLSLNFLISMAVLLLLLAALFKSVKDSLLVMVVVPLSIAGGIIALQVSSLFTIQRLDLLTMLGFIVMLGMVVNNAILLVEQTRHYQRQGSSQDAAVEAAVRDRIRPIFSSTCTSVIGMLPLILIPGATSVIYRGLAEIIVGGMIFSLLFSPLLLPSLLRSRAYSVINRTPLTIQTQRAA